MTEQATQATVHNTFVVERNYPRLPEKVFAAFAQPERKRRWYAEGNHEIQEFAMDFRVGGSDRFRYRFKEGHPIAGSEITNESLYEDIVENQRIVMAAKMSLNGKTTVVVLVTLEFAAAGTGTNLTLTHQGAFLDWEGGPQMLEMGWRELFARLENYLSE